MESNPGKQSQALGKLFSMQGRTSTNVRESLLVPGKDQLVQPSRKTSKFSRKMRNSSGWTARPGEGHTEIGNASAETTGNGHPDTLAPKGGTECDVTSVKSVASTVYESTQEMKSPEGSIFKNNPIVGNQEFIGPQVHYRLLGEDAKKYAMRNLGSVDTLLNHYGYKDAVRRRFQY